MSEAERGLEGCPGVFLFLFLKMGGAFQPSELSECLPTIGDTRSDVSESLPQVGGNRSGVSESLPQVGGNLSGWSESLPQVGGSRSEHIDRICRSVFIRRPRPNPCRHVAATGWPQTSGIHQKKR